MDSRTQLRLLGQMDLGAWVEVATGNEIWSVQRRIAEAASKRRARVAVPSCNASGKATRSSEPVLTPTGWRAIGTLAVGDEIIAGDGTTTTVTGVYPQGRQQLYRFHLDSGVTVDSAGTHLWAVDAWEHAPGTGARYTKQRRVLMTDDIIARYGGLGSKPNPRKRVSLPMVEPVQFPARPTPVDPYVLGLLLGDGGLTNGVTISTADDEVVAAIRAAGYRVKRYGAYDYGVAGIKAALQDLGVHGFRSHEKTIPEAYLWNTPEARLAVLQGLMDSDGGISGAGTEFTTTSHKMAEQVRFLVQSLGGRASVTERTTTYPYKGELRTGRMSYRMHVTMPVCPFRLTRKASAWQALADTRRKTLAYTIQWVEQVDEDEAVCISVAHPSRLFVIGNFLVTHNTFLAARLALAFYDAYTPGTPCVACDPTGTKGGCRGSKILTTSSKFEHLRDALWAEMRHAHAQLAQRGLLLPGTMARGQNLRLDDGPDHIIVGHSPNSAEGFQGFHCFSDDTELLTDRGWLRFPDLLGDERVLTLNGDVAEWGPITQIHKYRYSGTLAEHDGTKVNFAITDNHRLLARGKTNSSWSLTPYEDLPEVFTVRRTNAWAGSNPETIRFEAPEFAGRTGRHPRTYEFDFNDWAELLGWFVSEGHVSEWGGQWTVGIAQSQTANPEKYERISALLKRMGIRHARMASGFAFRSRPVAYHLRDHCGKGAKNKHVPGYMKNASAAAMDRFLESFGLGDGTPHNGGTRYFTASKALADDLHEMLAKLGRARSVSERPPSVLGTGTIYVINDPKKPVDSTVKKANVTRLPYDGFVWCVSTPHQTIMVRRKGRAMWSGNSAHKLILGDEATSLDAQMQQGITGLLATGDSRLLLIFNPTTDDTYAALECRSPRTEVIKITAYDTPHFTGEHVPEGSNLTTPEWLDELQDKGMGPGTFEWTTRVLADFWTIGDDVLISGDTYDKAATTAYIEGTRQLGIDLAPYGSDENVIVVRDGNAVVSLKAYPAMRQDMFWEGPVADEVRRVDPHYISWDADGVGSGVYGYADTIATKHNANGGNVVLLPFRGGVKVDARYNNARSAWWWNLRRKFEAHTISLAPLPPDQKLREQITDIRYSITPTGDIKVETKEHMKKRGRESPDRGDSVMYAFALVDELPVPTKLTETPLLDIAGMSDRSVEAMKHRDRERLRRGQQGHRTSPWERQPAGRVWDDL